MPNYNQTTTLLAAINRQILPTTLLVDTFFPHETTFLTESFQVEYRKGSRMMAPFITPGGKGVNMRREGSVLREYKPPIMAPKRNITLSDVAMRGFGEDIYSQKTPEERAMEMRARDIAELMDMNIRRQEWMAAQLLTTGECEIHGYADDGKTEKIDTFVLDGFENKVTLSGADNWDTETAKIRENVGDMSLKISAATGMVPDVAIMTRKVADYIINNQKIADKLMIPSRDNLAIMSIQPRIVRPEVVRVGYWAEFNLELYAYNATYLDFDGSLKSYIPEDTFVMGVSGRGKRYYGAISQLEESDRQLHTYEGKHIPKITTDIENDVSSLRLASRCLLLPEYVDDFGCIKVKS